ncbi:MAG: hypothetical protein J6Y19_05140 [Kiritimatiellae bacterium]|nr:hypothetical protein [Kiritimatiellia bacterium]
MPRRTKKTEDEKTIPEMAEDVARVEMSLMYKDGKRTSYGREMAKILDRALPPEKVDEWGFLLSRKEREAVKREAEEKKRIAAEKRAKAAAIRRIRRKAKEGGFGADDELDDFARVNWAFMSARDELAVRGFSVELMNELRRKVSARISPWIKQNHMDYVNYFTYQYYRACSEVQIGTLPASRQAAARRKWEEILRSIKRREPWLCRP